MNYTYYKKNKGFTLIELMVSVAIFAIVLVIALGSILTILDSNRKARTLTEVMSNINFSLESMTRSIKTGVNPQYDPQTGILSVTGIDLSQDNFTRQVISYKRSESDGRGYLEKKVGGGSWIPITSDLVDIKRMQVTTVAAEEGGLSFQDLDQPRTQITLEGEVSITEDISSSFTIQTTISQRKLNLAGVE
jgi:prepilin-type N-terminal cleavage/methylation domain-containing protein